MQKRLFELPLIFAEHDPEIPVALILTFVPIFIVTDDVVIVIRPGIWCDLLSHRRAVSNLTAWFDRDSRSVSESQVSQGQNQTLWSRCPSRLRG